MRTLTLRPDQPFDLHQTLSCGQVFRWQKEDNGWWQGIVGAQVIRIHQDGNTLTFRGASPKVIRDYFALDMNLPEILASIDRDTAIHAAIESNRGLRIIQQPPWECTLSYLIATFSNIPTIQRRIEALSREFGKKISEEEKYYGFPDPKAFRSRCLDSLENCRLGYRRSYLEDTACRLASDTGWEDRIRALSYEESRKELMTLRGIGPKAADCILLFAFQRYEAFPVDVWIHRIMEERYPDLRGKGNEAIRRFGQEYFGKYAGYAQEYLFAARQVPMSQASW
ncbi:MAG: 8-oxoguanine DNA glycosylase [Methanomicrobiales archaeon]|nr:8-oxoguanine DNA glycosylase [Methanomicrobiales archaeon]